jgi:hypothetical protein
MFLSSLAPPEVVALWASLRREILLLLIGYDSDASVNDNNL